MQRELIEIADDREQFLWAIGCVWFSYVERINIMRDSFRACFDYAFGAISILLGLLFLSPLFGFVFRIESIYRGDRPQWMPAILIALALIGAIELIGGVEKMLHSHKQRSLTCTHET
jgi:hypothetical protein